MTDPAEVTFVQRHRKFLAALAAVAGEAVTLGLAHGTVALALTLAIAFLGSLGVYQLPNELTVEEKQKAANDAGFVSVGSAVVWVLAIIGIVLLLLLLIGVIGHR